MVLAYIGLGSNLRQPKNQLRMALEALSALESSSVLQQSSLYRSRPVGPQEQPNFFNAVALMQTMLSPHALLTALQGIEQAQGRVRGRRWGPRTLDLDILLYDELRLRDEHLVLPHPELSHRNFVLLPLAEISPALSIPMLGSVSDLLARCPSNPIEKLSGV